LHLKYIIKEVKRNIDLLRLSQVESRQIGNLKNILSVGAASGRYGRHGYSSPPESSLPSSEPHAKSNRHTCAMAKTSNWQTYILLVKGNIGPGCLALPFCFSMLGPYVSLSFVLFIGFFCVYNMWVLVKCKRKIPGIKTYGELASATLGRYGETIVEFFLALMQLSICCVYFSFIGRLL
jgi:hypothetical protein